MDCKEIALCWFTEHTRSKCRYSFTIGIFSNERLNIALGIFVSASDELKISITDFHEVCHCEFC